jgi:hypothetical protein
MYPQLVNASLVYVVAPLRVLTIATISDDNLRLQINSDRSRFSIVIQIISPYF